MQIILLEKVANLGNLGDRVTVRSGYARNFLLPQGKATLATAANVTKFEARASVGSSASTRQRLAHQAATPAIKPPPPTLTSTWSGRPAWASISCASVPAGRRLPPPPCGRRSSC